MMCHVLIIEDEPLLAFDLQDMLAAAGATSFAFAETEDEAVSEARARRPDVITSDVMLREGTGPRAVAVIVEELGPVPVLFITASPDQCTPCDPPTRILAKPIADEMVRAAFREIAPVR
ncbi:response regulator [Sphingomonas sp. NFR15]|uniref:response regulator n=2 Tax=Sphingomonas TaxID=13687 RepID=UPI000889C447|nr:response regulator [Sphingomonas sp. NFR15]SDA26987.1 Response regulator receiver domain-containing protein [Sphingomonas sp. NFR15]